MLGSSDILALARGQEQVDFRTQRSCALPDHLCLPPVPRPWPSSHALSDTVLLYEIGRGVGPQLIFTAPPTVRPHAHLDLVLRLLAGGYQATGVGSHSGCGCLEDSWMLLGDSSVGVSVYVRYVSLLDLRVTGGVWPVAMALVSHDSVKLLQELEELNNAFGHASHTLKTANNTHTHTDQRWTEDGEAERREERERQKREGGEREMEGERETGEAGPWPTAELCDWFLYQQTLDLLCAIQRRFHGDASLLANRRECANLLPRLSHTNFLFEDTPPSQHAPHVTRSPSNPDVSCVEAVPIKLKAELGDSVSQSELSIQPAAHEEEGVPMVTGSHSSGDSIEVLATERSLRDPFATEPGWGPAPPQQLSLVTTETSWGSGLRVRAWQGAERTDSQDSSIEVLNRDYSYQWDDFRPAEPLLLHGLKGSVVQEEEEEEEEESWQQGHLGTVVQEEEGFQGHAEQQEFVGTVVQGNAVQQGFVGTVVQGNAEQQGFVGTVVQGNAEQQRFVGTVVQGNAEQQGFVGTVVQECLFSLCTPAKLDLHLHDNVCQEVCPLVGLLPLCPLGNKTREGGRGNGEAALRLVRGWGYTPHAVFSLLIGRPLVVVGADERKVRELVCALELFLPNTHAYTHTHAHTHAHTHSPRVLPWCCRPILITDLLEFGIIGLNSQSHPRTPLCLERYTRYLSILDADHMTLRCPAYRGALIGSFTEPQSQLRGGGTYALLVQSALTRLAARAFYRVFSGQESELPPGALDDDIRILNFLSDIIKLRLTHHAPSNVLRFSYQMCTLFR